MGTNEKKTAFRGLSLVAGNSSKACRRSCSDHNDDSGYVTGSLVASTGEEADPVHHRGGKEKERQQYDSFSEGDQEEPKGVQRTEIKSSHECL